jgi:flagellin-like hook-associated protein FlgL
MKKKLLTLLVMATFAAALCLQMTPTVYANHTAEVVWLGPKDELLTNEMFVKSPPQWEKGVWLNFSVTNKAGDGIVEVKLVIPRDSGTNNVYFWYGGSNLEKAASGWGSVPDEFDPDGYPGVIHFTGPAITTASTNGIFRIKFVKGPAFCTYKFMVYTVDEGTPAQTNPYPLTLMIDNTTPVVDIVYPSDGATVKAIWDVYPDMHYLWINATANDKSAAPSVHDSGIKSVQVQITNVTKMGDNKKYASGWVDITANKTDEKYYIKWRSYYTVSGKASVKWPPIVYNGTYKVEVKVFDGVGNTASKSLNFKYEIPVPLKLTPDHATAAREVDTIIKDKTKGLVEAKPYEYGVLTHKTLGTTIEAKGTDGTFNPGAVVKITVRLTTYTWYFNKYKTFEVLVREVTATSAGGFTTSFVCPAAPMGEYQVSAIDAKGNKGYATLTVEPEIIYQPEAVVGPAVIEAVATGLPGNEKVDLFTIDGTDALLGTNWQVIAYWWTNPNGTLFTTMADKPGFLMPVLEPKTYEVAIGFYETPEASAALLDGKPILVSNKLHVINDFPGMMQLLDALEIKLDAIKPIIDTIDGNVATIKTDVGIVKGNLADVITSITITKGDVAEIKTKVGTIQGKVESVSADAITIKTNVGTMTAKIESIDTSTGTIKTDLGTVKAKVESIDTSTGTIKTNVETVSGNVDEVKSAVTGISTLSISLSVVLSAVAAIAAIAAAVVVTRRLKVAA